MASRRVLMPFAPSPHSADATRAWVAGQLLPGGGVTLAWQGRELTGVLAIQVVAGQGWIEQLYIAPTHVGQGIGSRLLGHALAQLPRPRVLVPRSRPMRGHGASTRRMVFVARAIQRRPATNEERCPDVFYELAGGLNG